MYESGTYNKSKMVFIRILKFLYLKKNDVIYKNICMHIRPYDIQK